MEYFKPFLASNKEMNNFDNRNVINNFGISKFNDEKE